MKLDDRWSGSESWSWHSAELINHSKQPRRITCSAVEIGISPIPCHPLVSFLHLVARMYPPRMTRSRARKRETAASERPAPEQNAIESPAPSAATGRAATWRRLDADTMLEEILKLPEQDAVLLRLKQQKLQDEDAQVPTIIRASQVSRKAKDTQLAHVAGATPVFAQETARTVVCIRPTGLILTCSRCIAETEHDYDPDRTSWFLFASGDPVQAKSVAWDPH